MVDMGSGQQHQNGEEKQDERNESMREVHFGPRFLLSAAKILSVIDKINGVKPIHS